MKQRFLWMLTLLLLLSPVARAEDEWRVAEGLPELKITWRDTGESTGNDRRPYLLAAEIVARDGSFSQEVRWLSAEANDRIALHARLVDYNFDGYKDLQLLTAQGPRNSFYTVALWDVEKGCFREVTQNSPRLPRGKSANKMGQAEFCNPEFYPDAATQGLIYCVEEDGFFYRTEYVHGWEARYALENYWVAAVYDAGPGLIGESLEQWGTGINRWWNQTYPEDWYYGEGNANAKRTEARRLLMLGRGAVEPYWMQVANVDWVNLRQLDSKDSPSLAKLERGATVQVLATGCGEDGGWVLVLVHADHSSDNDCELDGMTGYIWHSYLEPDFMCVANVDWVNVRESADKQSDVVVTLNKGELVDVGENVNGWVYVDGWAAAEGFSDTQPYCGWIWHSYLEPEPFIPWR